MEMDAGSSSSSNSRGRRDSLPMYSLPPPRYEDELDGDMTVVDGFQYTPTTSVDDTPDSSVIDCSPRMSCDTGRTVVTKAGRD